jgi:predicted ATPase
MLNTLAISGYRSLRDLVIPLDRLNLVTGPNGSGKSNLYRALRLLAETAQGRIIPSLAREGGLQSTLWAGPEAFSRAVLRGDHPVQGTGRKGPVSLRLGFATEDFSYAIDLGLPAPPTVAFGHDPEIKRECVWSGKVLRPSAVLVDRRGPLVKSRDSKEWAIVTHTLASFDSMMTHCADPRSTPELLMLREEMRAWRFYDHFRTDTLAPARLPQIGTHTPVLSHDGSDLAAALQTIREIGDAAAIDRAVADAFRRARRGRLWQRLVRGGDAPARVAAAAESGGALRRNVEVSPLGGRSTDASSARAARTQRAGNEPAPRSAACARAPHRRHRDACAGRRRVARPGVDRFPAAAAGMPLGVSREALRRNAMGL